jgi:hypothetical protein
VRLLRDSGLNQRLAQMIKISLSCAILQAGDAGKYRWVVVAAVFQRLRFNGATPV